MLILTAIMQDWNLSLGEDLTDQVPVGLLIPTCLVLHALDAVNRHASFLKEIVNCHLRIKHLPVVQKVSGDSLVFHEVFAAFALVPSVLDAHLDSNNARWDLGLEQTFCEDLTDQVLLKVRGL
jgi:hypothetical protein